MSVTNKPSYDVSLIGKIVWYQDVLVKVYELAEEPTETKVNIIDPDTRLPFGSVPLSYLTEKSFIADATQKPIDTSLVESIIGRVMFWQSNRVLVTRVHTPASKGKVYVEGCMDPSYKALVNVADLSANLHHDFEEAAQLEKDKIMDQKLRDISALVSHVANELQDLASQIRNLSNK